MLELLGLKQYYELKDRRNLKESPGKTWLKTLKSKIIFWGIVGLILLTCYLNIGWALGTYIHNSVFIKDVHQTFLQKFWHGPVNWHVRESKKHSLLEDQIIFSFSWLPTLIILTMIWIAYAITNTVIWTVYAIYYILWFIFAGGLAKLLGLG